MKVIYTPEFERDYRKLPEAIQLVAERREDVFKKDPFSPTLKTHRLKGKFKGFWSFSVNYHYRIVFEFGKKDTVYFHSIGDHRVYK